MASKHEAPLFLSSFETESNKICDAFNPRNWSRL